MTSVNSASNLYSAVLIKTKSSVAKAGDDATHSFVKSDQSSAFETRATDDSVGYARVASPHLPVESQLSSDVMAVLMSLSRQDGMPPMAGTEGVGAPFALYGDLRANTGGDADSSAPSPHSGVAAGADPESQRSTASDEPETGATVDAVSWLIAALTP